MKTNNTRKDKKLLDCDTLENTYVVNASNKGKYKDLVKVPYKNATMDASEFYFVYNPLKWLNSKCLSTMLKKPLMNISHELNYIAKEYKFILSKNFESSLSIEYIKKVEKKMSSLGLDVTALKKEALTTKLTKQNKLQDDKLK